MIQDIMDCYSDSLEKIRLSRVLHLTFLYSPKYLEDERGIKGTVPQAFDLRFFS
jgi:hypothetical protein